MHQNRPQIQYKSFQQNGLLQNDRCLGGALEEQAMSFANFTGLVDGRRGQGH